MNIVDETKQERLQLTLRELADSRRGGVFRLNGYTYQLLSGGVTAFVRPFDHPGCCVVVNLANGEAIVFDELELVYPLDADLHVKKIRK